MCKTSAACYFVLSACSCSCSVAEVPPLWGRVSCLLIRRACEEYSAVWKYRTLYTWRLGVYSNRKLYYPSEQLRCINSAVSLLLLLFLLHLLAALPPSAKRSSAAASDGPPWDSPRLAACVCVGWETSFCSLANLSSVLHKKNPPFVIAVEC